MRKLILAFCLGLPALAADIYTFTVPDGVTSGAASNGFVTGWGYSIYNQSTSLWLVTTGLSVGTFQYATPTSLFDFPDIAPGQTVTVPYNAATASGLFQIAWNANVPAGFVDYGAFNLSAQWWNGNPQSGGAPVATAPGASQPYSASLTAVPEPGTAGIVALCLILFVLAGCRRYFVSIVRLSPSREI